MSSSSLLSELFEDALIPVKEQMNIIDTVFEHGDALKSGAEGKACPLIGIETAVRDDTAVDHASAEDLYPAGPLAEAASFSSAASMVAIL